MRASRSLAPIVVSTAIVLFAVISAPRLALDFAPSAAEPEVVASIRLAASSDPAEVTRRWMLPIESAVRSLGDVLATRGEVAGDSGYLTVRFRRGVGPQLKAARLATELAPLRAKLPAGASLDVWPSVDSGERPSAVYALTGRGASESAAAITDELRSLPGVRDVGTYGAAEKQVAVRLAPDVQLSASEVTERLLGVITPRHLGASALASRRLSVIATPPVTNLRDAVIAAPSLSLGAMATISERREEPRTVARLNGRPAVVLAVIRDADVSLFDFDAAVRRALAPRHAAEVWSDARELRTLLIRIALGALAATLLFAVRRSPLAFYIPLAFAVLINICRIAALRVDAYGILAATLAIAGLTPLVAVRNRRWPLVAAALFTAIPAVGVTLASSALAAMLTAPAKMFAIAGVAAAIAAVILSRENGEGSLLRNRHATKRSFAALRMMGIERRLLRASPTIVLTAVAVATLLLSWFGKGLNPNASQHGSERSRIYIRVVLPQGTTLAQTIEPVSRIERSLRTIEGIERFWTTASPGRATISADLDSSAQRSDARALLKLRVRLAMPLGGSMVRIEDDYDAVAGRSASDIEEKPEADAKGNTYRVLLKGTDAAPLRTAYEIITTRMTRYGLNRSAVNAEWPEGTTRDELVPRRGVEPAAAREAAQWLAERTIPPRGRTLPDGRTIVVAAANAPKSYDDVPRAADLLPRLAGAFELRSEPVSGRVTRELGRFVLPVSIAVPGILIEQKLANRKDIDRTIATVPLAPGVVLERPRLGEWIFSRERLRLIALAALVPALLFALAAIVLSSLTRALIALAPAVVGIAFASPALIAADASLDEFTLLAIAAGLCCVTALAVTVVAMSKRPYRPFREYFRPALWASLAAAALLAVPINAHTDLGEAWRAPLLAAAVVIAAGSVAAALLPAAIVIVWDDLRRTLAARKRRPGFSPALLLSDDEKSRAEARPTLSVRNVTKVYGSGFRALHRVTFDLQPGIVGLLGPNGAGKTTLLRILTGLLLPTRGVIRYGGVDVVPENLASYRELIGFLPQEFNAYAGLTAAQFLDFWALERGITGGAARRDEVERLLAIARLEQHAGRRLRDFSGGMRQRIGIARAMIGDPPLLVVDEPTTGLDIEARAHFRDLITAIARDRIIILSTHIASDVEATASRLILLSRGRIVWDGAPERLIAEADGRVFETLASDDDARALTRRFRITTRVRVHDGIRMRGVVPEGEALPGARVEPTLEEAYLAAIAPAAGMRSGSFAFVFESAAAPASAATRR